MIKNNIFCHNCDAVISYKQEAWSKNDGEPDCPVFCSPECLCDYYDYYYNIPIISELKCDHCGRQLISHDVFWLNNDLFGDLPALKFCSAKCLCEHYGYIFAWHGEPEFIPDNKEDE